MQKANEVPMMDNLGMLWVLVLMACLVATVVGQKMNERRRMRIGVELELVKKHRLDGVDQYHSMAAWFKKNGIEAHKAEYGSATIPSATKIQYDGSLPSDTGFEAVSPPLNDGKHKSWIRSVFDALKGITKTPQTCSSHVHVGLKSHGKSWGEDGGYTYEEAQQIAGQTAYGYAYFEPGFDSIVSQSRRDNTYCRPMNYLLREFPNGLDHYWSEKNWNDETATYDVIKTAYTVEETARRMYDTVYNFGRYPKLNLKALDKYGTLEFRQHQAVNYDSTKLNNWIQLCYELTMRCADKASMLTIKQFPRTLDGLFDFLGMKDNSMHNYFSKRAIILSGGSLTTACTECGSYKCMEDNRCGTVAEAESNWAEYKELASNMVRPPYYRCDECEDYSVHSYDVNRVQFDMETLEWSGQLNDHCEGCECYQPTVTGHHMSAIGLGLMLMFPLLTAIALLVGCGIGAIHSAGKKFNAKNRFKKLFIGLSNRGSDAAGSIWQLPDKLMYRKDAISSEQLAHYVKKDLTSDVEWCISHTRAMTHGDNIADNAHPHWSSDHRVQLVHNGVITNYLSAWKELNRPQTGPVDSQVIPEAISIGGIEKVVEVIQGNMSLIWHNSDDPQGTIKCWTNGGNPLHMGRLDDAENGAVVIASTKIHLTEAFGSRLVTEWAAIIGREYTINPDGSITKRDIEGSAKTANLRVSWQDYKNYNDWWDNYPTAHKATGNADNCTVPNPSGIDQKLLDQAYNHVTSIKDEWGGWPAFSCEGKEFHGWDSLSNMGIKLNGIRYSLPATADIDENPNDIDKLLCGEFASIDKSFKEYWL